MLILLNRSGQWAWRWLLGEAVVAVVDDAGNSWGTHIEFLNFTLMNTV